LTVTTSVAPASVLLVLLVLLLGAISISEISWRVLAVEGVAERLVCQIMQLGGANHGWCVVRFEDDC
jgi:hypothetical protein